MGGGGLFDIVPEILFIVIQLQDIVFISFNFLIYTVFLLFIVIQLQEIVFISLNL